MIKNSQLYLIWRGVYDNVNPTGPRGGVDHLADMGGEGGEGAKGGYYC